MDEKTIITDSGSNGWGSVPAVWALNNGWGYGNGYGFGNGLFGGSGFGAGILGGILGGLIPGFFGGWGGNGFGMGNGAAAASLGAQATANNNTDTILRAIDGSDSDIRLLATTLNSDVDSIRLAINTVNGAIQTVGAQLGLTGQQVINAIQSGNSDISARICECCCNVKQLVQEQGFQNQLATLNQTNTLMGGNQRIVDAIADLKATTIDQFCQAEKRDMQDKINTQGQIITQLRNEADNARQTNALAAMLAPIAKEVDDIKCKLPSTATVQYPNLVAFSTTPNIGGFYGGFNGYGYGPGWGNGSYWG